MPKVGTIGLIGKPNVGKSTLLNQLIGQKVSITSNKPQTTQQALLAIYTQDNKQMVFIDTPGFNQVRKNPIKRVVNRAMNREALQVLSDVDIITWLIEPFCFANEETLLLNEIKKTKTPVILLINKIDKLEQREKLLAFLKTLSEKHTFTAIIPISAKKNIQLSDYISVCENHLSDSDHFLFPPTDVTVSDENFLLTECVREKIMRYTHAEIPYTSSVKLIGDESGDALRTLHMEIWVPKETHKGIVIGKNGKMLEYIGSAARADIMRITGIKVHLNLWVKVGTPKK